jgi:hypothetical protein
MSLNLKNNSVSANIALVAGLIFAILLFGLGLAWVSSGFVQFSGWIWFVCLSALSLILIAGCYWAVQKTEHTLLPRGLMGLILLAAILRLSTGILWYISLPTLGHGSPAEQGGYVMADAYQRDQAAWELAQSQKPLWKAFKNQRAVDQYGGFLFSSALIYRYAGGNFHQPLQVVLLTAAVSGLAVLFTWLLAHQIWDQKVAWVAAWFLALFPEAVLLGGSQMREALTITLTVIAFYGLVGYLKERSKVYLIWMFSAILLFLPLSPPFTAFLLVLLALTAIIYALPRFRLSKSSNNLPHQGYFWIVALLILVLVTAGVWFTLDQFAPEKINNPIAMVNWWINKSADWQAHLTERASGKIQAIFDRTPQWSHAYLLLAYGVGQPLLPAALVVTSQSPIWQSIAIWRSMGWTILLILLIYATFRAWIKKSSTLTRILTLLVWLTILVASFRGGGDQWDNPRYRATFLGLQVALASWGWVSYRRSNDKLFRYSVIWVILLMLWFVPWYLQREFHIPWVVNDALKTFAIGTITAILFIIWDWARTSKNFNT